jgi:hypothetical protein
MLIVPAQYNDTNQVTRSQHRVEILCLIDGFHRWSIAPAPSVKASFITKASESRLWKSHFQMYRATIYQRFWMRWTAWLQLIVQFCFFPLVWHKSSPDLQPISKRSTGSAVYSADNYHTSPVQWVLVKSSWAQEDPNKRCKKGLSVKFLHRTPIRLSWLSQPWCCC